MSKISKAHANNAREQDCASGDDDNEGNCPLQPKFKSGEDAVQLTRDKYVQLLIEARETDPGCWPPGLEDAARLLERACNIEEHCAVKHGHFEPERLSKKMRDEYLHIHLTLDELQSGLEQDADDHQADKENIAPISPPRGTWTETTSHARPENFA